MAYTTASRLAQLELLFDPNTAQLAAVIRQDRVSVLDDSGALVSASNVRSTYAAGSPEAQAAFGAALSAALVAAQDAQAAAASLQAELSAAQAQIAGLLPTEP